MRPGTTLCLHLNNPRGRWYGNPESAAATSRPPSVSRARAISGLDILLSFLSGDISARWRPQMIADDIGLIVILTINLIAKFLF